MPSYGFASTQVTIPATTKAFVMSGNQNRISLLIGLLNAGQYRLSYSSGSFGSDVFFTQSGIQQNVMHYRDYGPILRGPVFIENPTANPITVCFTEVYKIPGC